MNNNFLQYLKSGTEQQKDQIVLLPFFDNTVRTPDITMFYGIPFYLYEAYSPSNPGMIHPYLSFDHVNKKGLSGEKLAQAATAKQVAKDLKARYVVFGTYQKTFNGTLRVLINVYDAKTDTSLSPVESFESNTDDSFFDLITEHLATAFKRNKGTKPLKPVTGDTPGMAPFRYLSKGLELSGSYDMTALQLAALWFEKALKESFQKYDDATLNLARVYFMMSLIERLNKIDSTLNWQKAMSTLQYLTAKPKKWPLKFALTLRFPKAQALTLEAGTAYAVKNFKTANQLAAEALTLVPEDGILQHLYLLTNQGQQQKGLVTNDPVCF